MQWSARLEFNYVAQRLKRCSTLKQLESWYGLLVKSNTRQDCFLMNQYITACSKVGSIDSTILAFSQMDNPNVFVYNAIIGAFLNCFRPLEGLRHYVGMLRNGVRPSSYTLPPVIKSCRVLSVVGFGECVHGQLLRNGLGSHIHVQTALVDFYSSLSRAVESRKVFDEMAERDGFAWSAMVSAHARAGDLDNARKVFDEMPEKKNTAAWNAMIHGYVEAGNVKAAEQLFSRMLQRDVISWTIMINCYCKHKLFGEALQLFDEMKSAGVTPDDTTMATVISACAHLGALEKGKEMHWYVTRTRCNIDVYIGSALIDMYAKCGVLERALVVFFKLEEKNIFCWSCVIDGLAYHGYAKEALCMFDKMEEERIEPNGVVFLSALVACTHAGLVEEGKRRFLEMTTKYSIVAEIEHYGCMVDLLSRAGLVEEALALIGSMRREPNSVVWGALLSGCKLHKKLEIAELAVEKLMVLEPNNSGYYTLIINMYAEANRWDEVARIRGTMRECGVEKVLPGSSWIEVEKSVHHFGACDDHHPASQMIHHILSVLDSQLKLFGQGVLMYKN